MVGRDCIFCRIAQRDAPADIVLDNEKAIAIIPQEMEVFGHTLIMPKAHAETLLDCPPEDCTEIINLIKDLSLLYKNKFGMKGFNLLTANGTAAQQSVPHLHLHFFPRFDGDELHTWPVLPKLLKTRDEFLKIMKSQKV